MEAFFCFSKVALTFFSMLVLFLFCFFGYKPFLKSLLTLLKYCFCSMFWFPD